MHPWSAFVLTLLSLVVLSFHTQVAQADEDAPNTVHYEEDIYYYHTDHLNGTRYLTDQNGDVVETNLTFPGGETWVNQTITRSADDYKTPYTFTGKEQDASVCITTVHVTTTQGRKYGPVWIRFWISILATTQANYRV